MFCARKPPLTFPCPTLYHTFRNSLHTPRAQEIHPDHHHHYHNQQHHHFYCNHCDDNHHWIYLYDANIPFSISCTLESPSEDFQMIHIFYSHNLTVEVMCDVYKSNSQEVQLEEPDYKKRLKNCRHYVPRHMGCTEKLKCIVMECVISLKCGKCVRAQVHCITVCSLQSYAIKQGDSASWFLVCLMLQDYT